MWRLYCAGLFSWLPVPLLRLFAEKRFGQIKDYADWYSPRLVLNTLELLDKEILRLKGKIVSVQLCFTTDPFMYRYQEIADMAIASIKKLNAAGIKCTVLTKGIHPISLAELSNENKYGITLISLNEKYRKKMKPGASPYKDRLEALTALHNAGCKTWISMEPYPTPNMAEQDLQELLEYLYTGNVNCIYIDPPYNTRAKDWKYNNDYVDPGDQYRHSKWLSMKEYHVLPILQEAHGGQFINLALVDGGAGRRSRNHPEFS